MGTQMTSAEMAELIAGRTLVDLIADTVSERGDAPALHWKNPDGWSTLSWNDYIRSAQSVAAGLRRLGVRRGDRVAMLLRNRVECNITDIAGILLGAAMTSIYLTSSNSQLEWLLNHCEAGVILVDGEQFARVMEIKPQVPSLRTVLCVDETADTDESVVRFSELLGEPPVQLDEAKKVVKADDVATIIYTSGTTGRPKGAQHSHRSVVSGVESVLLAFGAGWMHKRVISYLPMAHVAERMFSHYVGLRTGSEVFFCSDLTAIGSYVLEVRPNIFFGPPRIWEKLWAAAQAIARGTPEPEGAELRRALEVGLQAVRARTETGEVPSDLEIALAEVEPGRNRIASAVALDTIDIALTAAASMPADVLDGMAALGVELADAYGMTEFIGGVCSPHDPRRGTLGRPFPGVDLRIAEDDEIEMRGPQAFVGYLNNPEQTKAVFTDDGWLRTGDLGRIDEDGYLTLIGRKKDLIITAGGKNIAPQPIETAIASHPLVSAAIVVGEARKFPAALIVPDPLELVEWAKSRGKDTTDPIALMSDPDLEAEILEHLQEVNQALARVEQIKRIKILPEVWGPDSEVMTPTMKVKRAVVAQKYADAIDSLYATDEQLAGSAPGS
ncbi:MAG: long-chain fatty acid--CoA ligase [Mycobacterium sp.]